MRLIRYLCSSFAREPDVPVRDDESRREAERRVVSRFATGNIRLQRGEYSTREDIDRVYEKIKSASFQDH